MALGTENITQIYVPLLDEGVDVWRPAQAIRVGNDLFRILLPSDYDSEDETWEFLPGSLVKCALKMLSGSEVLVAVEKVG